MKKWICCVLLLMAVFSVYTAKSAAGAQGLLAVQALAEYDSPRSEEYAQQVAVIVNRERADKGLEPLKLSDRLSAAANVRAREIQTLFAHTRPNQTAWSTVIDEANIDYYYAGENIAYGYKNPEAVMNAWMNSSSHRENILSESPKQIGVGVACQDGVYYWVQLFALSYDLDGKIPYASDTQVEITEQPKSVSAIEGSTIAFTVKAAGNGLTYQWQISDDSGKTWRASAVKTATYTTTLTSEIDGRCLRCVVTNKYGHSVTTNSASMKKILSPVITKQPKTAVVMRGDTATFTVEAMGNGLTYQWQFSDDAGQTWQNSDDDGHSAEYRVTLTGKNNGRRVRCEVSDKSGQVTSNVAVLWLTGLKITEQPKTAVVKKGDMVKFQVKAAGDGLAYQWQISDDAGETWRNSAVKNDIYYTVLADDNIGRRMRCVVSDKYGNQVVTKTVVMWMTGLKITLQPKSVAAKEGTMIHFAVKGIGDGVGYQWQISDDNGRTWRNSAVKASDYYTALSNTNDGRRMRCIVSDAYGNQEFSHSVIMMMLED